MIKSIEFSEPLVLSPYIKSHSLVLEKNLNTTKGLNIDFTLMKTNTDYTYWFLMNNTTIQIETEKYGNITLELSTGCFTDWASIPKVFRSVIDTTTEDIMVPSLIHDMLFRTGHFGKNRQGFHDTNDFFADLLEYNKVTDNTRFMLMTGVNTVIGRNIYMSNTNDNRFCTIK